MKTAPNHAPSLPTRASLLQRLKNTNDQQSWQDFYVTYKPMVLRIAYRAGLSEVEAQDVVQEVMKAMSMELPKFEYDPDKGRFKSWLCNQTRWKVIDQFRERGPTSQLPANAGSAPDLASPIENLPDPQSLVTSEMVEQEWRENQFAIAWSRVKATLDPLKIQIFEFYAMRGWKAEKVSDHFLVSVGVVRVTKSRVKEMIEEELQRMERELE